MNQLATTNATDLDLSLEETGIVGVETEKQRAIAEIQSALMVAHARPRDERRAIAKITDACQRPGLAEVSRYSYSRGGSDITGASIKLMQVIASYWGNIQFGFRELARGQTESLCQAFAWDLESNTKRTVDFTVPHMMKSGANLKRLTDPRDIYEYISNNAQRRVRTCLESLIPSDVVEDALSHCADTLQKKHPMTAESIGKLTEAFRDTYQVTTDHIEQRIGRAITAMTHAQYLKMRDIWKSLQEGMSKPSQWFAIEETPAGSSLKEKVKSKTVNKKSTKKEPEPKDDVDPLLAEFIEMLNASEDKNSAEQILKEYAAKTSDEGLFNAMADAVEAHYAEESK